MIHHERDCFSINKFYWIGFYDELDRNCAVIFYGTRKVDFFAIFLRFFWLSTGVQKPVEFDFLIVSERRAVGKHLLKDLRKKLRKLT